MARTSPLIKVRTVKKGNVSGVPDAADAGWTRNPYEYPYVRVVIIPKTIDGVGSSLNYAVYSKSDEGVFRVPRLGNGSPDIMSWWFAEQVAMDYIANRGPVNVALNYIETPANIGDNWEVDIYVQFFEAP